jgi:hypothetical protein
MTLDHILGSSTMIGYFAYLVLSLRPGIKRHRSSARLTPSITTSRDLQSAMRSSRAKRASLHDHSTGGE